MGYVGYGILVFYRVYLSKFGVTKINNIKKRDVK